MSDSWQRRERRFQELVGDLGLARVRPTKYGGLVYAIRCRVPHEGSKGDRMAGDTYRSGYPNTFRDALERWARHLEYAHPESSAPPCLALLQRLRALDDSRRDS